MTAINKFNTSMIYSIRSPATERYYIGSTTQKLCKRFSDHNINYKSYLKGTSNFMTSFKIIELGDSYIELLELYPCNLKAELHKREGELIREHKNNCVNKSIAGRTDKEYRIENRDKIKAYCIDNKEEITKQKKQYYVDNKESISKKNNQYRIDNKESIKAQKKLPYVCSCGSTIRTSDKARHNKSAKHLKALEQEKIIV